MPDRLRLLGAKLQPPKGFLKEGAGIEQFHILIPVFEVADIPQRKDRLTAVALAAAHRGNRAGGRNRRLGGVADPVPANAVRDLVPVQDGAIPIPAMRGERLGRRPTHPAGLLVIVDAAFEGQEWLTFRRKLNAHLHAVEAHEFHHLGGEFLAILAAVADAHLVHQIAQAHDAESNPTRLKRRLFYFLHSRQIGVGADYIIQEVRALAHCLPQRLPVHRGRAGASGCGMRAQVDRAEAAVLIRPQPLFTARVCRFQIVKMRDRVAAVGRVDKQRAGFAVMMGVLDDRSEQVAGPHCSGYGAIAGVAQVEIAIVFHGLHELVGDGDGDIEIGDCALFGLAADELLDVGMIDPQDTHIGAAAGSPLRDLAEGLIIDSQKADRPGCPPG